MGDEKGFTDPVVRCMSCSQLMLIGSVKKSGCCPKCGNKRVTNVRTLTEEEMGKLKDKGVSQTFLDEFEGADDADLI